MVGGLGPLELSILLLLFFVLFGAQRLPELANALGRSKGEFHKGLNEATTLGDTNQTIADLEDTQGESEATKQGRGRAHRADGYDARVGGDPRDRSGDIYDEQVLRCLLLAAARHDAIHGALDSRL